LDLTEKVRIYMHGVPSGTESERRERQLATFRTGDILAPALPETEPLAEVVTAFAASIGGAPSISNGQHGLAVMRSMEAAMESIARGGAYVPTGTLVQAGAVA
jgi:predicted dehydrogenase